MGFHLFQGYFFSKPVVHKRNKLLHNRAFALKLMHEVNVESPNLNRIEDLLKRDVSLSFKIMRYAQNILYNKRGITGLRNQSLKDIVVYLGINELRRFVLVACLTSFETVKTTEIYYLSLIRAKFCELAAARTPLTRYLTKPLWLDYSRYWM
jgi:EAL and modified HD-GYP domain-containing signal transduction protein